MIEFLRSFNAWHFVALVFTAMLWRVAKTIGARLARSIVDLNDNLKALRSTILKAEIMWDRSADHEMLREFSRRLERHA